MRPDIAPAAGVAPAGLRRHGDADLVWPVLARLAQIRAVREIETTDRFAAPLTEVLGRA